MIQAIIIDITFSNLHESNIQELAYVNTSNGESMSYFLLSNEVIFKFQFNIKIHDLISKIRQKRN